MPAIDGVTNAMVLEELFKMMPSDERAILCSVPGDPGAAAPTAWGGIPWQRGARCPLLPDRNNYVAISSFRQSESDGRYRRRKDQFGATHAIMIDDVGTKLKLDVVPRDLVPSLVVETSPGNFQVTFFLDRPQTDQSFAEDAIRQMIEKLTGGGADPGMAGVTRVLRLPEGINGKPKYIRDEALWRCKVYVWRPDIRTSWEELRRAFGLVERHKTFIEPTDGVTQERIRGYRIVKAGLRSLGLVKRDGQRWMDIRCPWIETHTDRGDTGAAVAPPMQANGYYGGFKCHHGHCQQRTWNDLEDYVAREVWKEGRRTRGMFTGLIE
jgi:hypothetical protein